MESLPREYPRLAHRSVKDNLDPSQGVPPEQVQLGYWLQNRGRRHEDVIRLSR